MCNLTKQILEAGVENVSFKLPMSPLNNVLGIVFTCSSDEETTVKCHISEDRHRVADGHKITLEADDTNFGFRHFYLSDLGNLIESGSVEMIVGDQNETQ